MDDSRWDWDVERFDWKHYQAGFCDPTILRTTVAVFLNTLKLDDVGNVVNYQDATLEHFSISGHSLIQHTIREYHAALSVIRVRGTWESGPKNAESRFPAELHDANRYAPDKPSGNVENGVYGLRSRSRDGFT
jgi:hypothetical protein